MIAPRQEPVAIGHLERFVADWEREHGGASLQPADHCATRGLRSSARARRAYVAGDLARLGYRVTIYEALHAPGGVLRYGIPEFRLPKAILDGNIDQLRELGVEIVCNVVIGKTLTVDQLTSELGFGAVFVGTGAGAPVFLGVPGENLNGVNSANEFLTRVNLMHAYAFPEYDTPIRRPTRAAVIGAGNTAMDAVRSSIRLGAQEAHIVYRRSEQEMGARVEDYHQASEEGVIFDWLTLPRRFIGDDDGWVTGLKCIRMKLGEPDAVGPRRPIPDRGQ